MNTLFYSLLLVPFLVATAADTPLWEKMETMRWKNRVVVVYAPKPTSPELLKQQQFLANKTAEIQDRDMVVIDCIGSTLSSEDKNYIQRHFNHNLSTFGVWLVGKDGGIKHTSTQPVTAEKFFGMIDAMPMRRSEIKND